MSTPNIDIAFHRLPFLESIAHSLREQLEAVKRHHREVDYFHVVVDLPHRHHRKGNAWRLTVTTQARGRRQPVVVQHERVGGEAELLALVHEVRLRLDRKLSRLVGRARAGRSRKPDRWAEEPPTDE